MESKKNIHAGHRERMRKRVLENGASSLETHELVEMLLYYCVPTKNTNELAHRLLEECNNLVSGLMAYNPVELSKKMNIKISTAMIFTLVNELHRRCQKENLAVKETLNGTIEAGLYAMSLYQNDRNESFYVISLDNQFRIINTTLVRTGTPGQIFLHPREVVEIPFRYRASNVVLVHNHPGNFLYASKSDITTTNRLVNLLNTFDIWVIDHIIVGEGDYFSMADHGLIENHESTKQAAEEKEEFDGKETL